MGVQGGMAGDPALLSTLVRESARHQLAGHRRGQGQSADDDIGLAMGGNARTGLEDTLLLEPGVPAESNAQLVERLVSVARSVGREPATVEEVVERLQLSPALVRGA